MRLGGGGLLVFKRKIKVPSFMKPSIFICFLREISPCFEFVSRNSHVKSRENNSNQGEISRRMQKNIALLLTFKDSRQT